jgi:hypothetical protein
MLKIVVMKLMAPRIERAGQVDGQDGAVHGGAGVS